MPSFTSVQGISPKPRSHGHIARLGKHVHLAPPRSRVVESHFLGGNGSSIPAGGDVWPTAIYYATVQIGTPPQDFPVAIDSGSGDLDVSGKGCIGCVTTGAPALLFFFPTASRLIPSLTWLLTLWNSAWPGYRSFSERYSHRRMIDECARHERAPIC